MSLTTGFSLLRNTTSIATTLLLLSGCGVNKTNSQLADVSEEDTRPLFITQGGNESCANNLKMVQKHRIEGVYKIAQNPSSTGVYTSLNNTLNDLGISAEDVDFIYSCFKDRKVYFIDSQSPADIQEAGDDFSNLYNIISIRWDEAPDRQVYIMGHSYGGWLSMQTVMNLGEDRTFEGLYTLDPISFTRCSFSTPGGCTSAPQDISGDQRQMIQDSTNNWVNFYQTRTWYLHSSSINHADDNHHISTSHSNIDNTSQSWDKIAADLSERTL